MSTLFYIHFKVQVELLHIFDEQQELEWCTQKSDTTWERSSVGAKLCAKKQLNIE